MVESVSAVDGSNISEVVENIGANSAVCSDRHFMLLSQRSPCCGWDTNPALDAIQCASHLVHKRIYLRTRLVWLTT